MFGGSVHEGALPNGTTEHCLDRAVALVPQKPTKALKVPCDGCRLPLVVGYEQLFAESVEVIGCHGDCLQRAGSGIKITRLRACSHDLQASSHNATSHVNTCLDIEPVPKSKSEALPAASRTPANTSRHSKASPTRI